MLYVYIFLKGLRSGTLWNYRLSPFFVRKSDANGKESEEIKKGIEVRFDTT